LCFANLVGTNLTGADINNAKGDFSDFSGAYLYKANLQESDMGCACFDGADLSYANLESANLQGATLIWADLASANLAKSYCVNADLSNANLGNANLQDANLRGANLQGADLCDADLRGVLLGKNNLMGTKLEGADLSELTISIGSEELRLPSSCTEGMLRVLMKFSEDVPPNSYVTYKNFPLSDDERHQIWRAKKSGILSSFLSGMGWKEVSASRIALDLNSREPYQVTLEEFDSLPQDMQEKLLLIERNLAAQVEAARGGFPALASGNVTVKDIEKDGIKQLTVSFFYEAIGVEEHGVTAAIVNLRDVYPAGSQPKIDAIKKVVGAAVEFDENGVVINFNMPDTAALRGRFLGRERISRHCQVTIGY
jgi:hypothetical protein